MTIKSSEERILAAVQDGQLNGTVLEFATEIGLTHEVVYRGLANLVKSGSIKKIGRGKFQPL